MSDPPAGRLMLGFVLLPPAAGLIMFVTAYMAWQMDVWFLNGSGSLDASISVGAGVALLAVPLTGIAVAAVVWLIGRGRTSWADIVWAGVFVGNAPFIVIVSVVLLRVVLSELPASDLPEWFSPTILIRSVFLGVWVGGLLGNLLWLVVFLPSTGEGRETMDAD